MMFHWSKFISEFMHLQAGGRWTAREQRRRSHIPTFSSQLIILRRWVSASCVFLTICSWFWALFYKQNLYLLADILVFWQQFSLAATSALKVFFLNTMQYINLSFSYLLTFFKHELPILMYSQIVGEVVNFYAFCNPWLSRCYISSRGGNSYFYFNSYSVTFGKLMIN